MTKLSSLAAAAALALVFTGSAGADEGDTPKSRAEVVAELNAARASGELAALNGEDGGAFFLSQRSAGPVRQRQEVLAELAAARRSGEMNWLFGEDSGSFVLSRNMPAHWARYAGPDIGDKAPEQRARTTNAG